MLEAVLLLYLMLIFFVSKAGQRFPSWHLGAAIPMWMW